MREDYPLQSDIADFNIYTSMKGIDVTVGTSLRMDVAESVWSMVQHGFVDLNAKSYEKQDMTHEEFMADALSTGVFKYVATDKDGTAIGYLTVHRGLKNISWIDKDLVLKAQSEVDKEANPFYIGTLVVQPNLRGGTAAKNLLQGALLHFQRENEASGHQALCFFDCADANYPKLGHFIQSVAKPSTGYDGVPISVKQLYEEYWVKDLATGKVEKLGHKPDPIEEALIIDTEHVYAVQLM
jgi:hypothetical protein